MDILENKASVSIYDTPVKLQKIEKSKKHAKVNHIRKAIENNHLDVSTLDKI